jgi:hypothetical protein
VTALGCDAEEEAEAAPAALRCLAGERTSNAVAMMASTGTMQKAQTHPLEAVGFDKTILL